MATIKITTDGKVITKNGKPSCTCCGCSPNYTVIYVRFYTGYPEVTIQYYTIVGSLNLGYFYMIEGEEVSSLLWIEPFPGQEPFEPFWQYLGGTFCGNDRCSPMSVPGVVEFSYTPWV
jgi:hypothetical protein